MNQNTRIEMDDSVTDMIMKMSEGNPGAISVLFKIMKETPSIDPQNALEGLSAIFSLDLNGIYGPSIWMLYKDVCGESTVKTLAVLRAMQLGIVTGKTVLAAIDDYGRGLDVDGLLLKVKERLNRFDKKEA